MKSTHTPINDLIEKIEKVLFSDYDQAGQLLEQLLDLSYKENDPYGLYVANNMLGILSSDMGRMDESMKYFSMAMSYMAFEALKDEKPVLLNNIGNIMIVNKDYYGAIEQFTTALDLIHSSGERKDMIFTLNLNIADAYLHINEPKEAIEVITQAMSYFDPENIDDKAVMLGTLSHAYLLLKDFDQAFEHILKCEEAAAFSSFLAIQIQVDYYKAKYFEVLGDYNDAERFYNKTIQRQIEGESYYNFNQVATDYIKFMIERRKYEKAIPFIYKSLDLARLKHWQWAILDYDRLLAQCYAALSKWDLAEKAIVDYFDVDFALKTKSNQQHYHILKTQEKVLEMSMRNRDLSDTVDRLKATNNILKEVNASTNIESLVEVLYASLSELFKLDTFGLGIYDFQKEHIHYISKFENGVSLGNSHIDFDNPKSFSAWVKRNNKPVIIHDMDHFEKVKESYPNVKMVKEDIENTGNHSKSIIIWPMKIEDRYIGQINCQSVEKNRFSSFDLELIEMLSAHLAIAIENFHQKNELSQAIERLNRLSYYDSLTSVYNRQALNEYLPAMYQKAITEHNNIAFAMIDLDHFKELNDQYGHQEGDLCLAAFAKVLKKVVGELGYIYRYGGDEFSILFIGLEFDVVEDLLEKIIEQSKFFYEMGDILRITASIGAVYATNGEVSGNSLSSFINYADNALYIAKHEGKNTYRKVII